MTLYKFTPDLVDPTIIKQMTVGRERLMLDLTNRIKEHAIKKIPFHLIFIGPRGIGKTHLLLLIYYKITDTPELSNIVKPIKLSEEEYSVVKLSDLFRRILEEAGITVLGKDPESIIEEAVVYLNRVKRENATPLD